MKETILSIAKWHEETFPDATLEGQLKKYEEERDEFISSDFKDLSELADMFIVACGIARFDIKLGFSALLNVSFWRSFIKMQDFDKDNFVKVIEQKMEKNRKRVWTKTAEGSYHHVNKEN